MCSRLKHWFKITWVYFYNASIKDLCLPSKGESEGYNEFSWKDWRPPCVLHFDNR